LITHVFGRVDDPPQDVDNPELIELVERVKALPREVRTELEPVVGDVLEQARFRSRVLTVAREALERLRLDLEIARFDLDATRRERESLRRMLDELV
jgi:hypothetical protein